MADTFARVGDAVVGYAVTGTSDMPDFSGDHFTWEGHCWEAVTDPGLLVATMDPAASPAAKEALTARIVQAMSVATKKLVVTEEAILNHATLIGQTVVDDINVQGKLIGTDGVFTGTVDFENINVTDEVLASRISGEHIYGTVIEGGLFKTSDALPGQVELADDAYVTHFDGGGTYPGLRITPIDTSQMNLPAAIGPSASGLTIFGGRNTSGGTSIVQCNPTGAFLRSFRPDGSIGGESQAGPTESLMRTYGTDGVSRGVMETAPTYAQMVVRASNNTSRGLIYANTSTANLRVFNANNAMVGRIHVDANESYLFSAAGGSNRYLSVDANGIWAKTNESGSWQSISLVPQVRQFQYSALWNMDLSPSPIMVQHLPGGKLCQAQARIQNRTGSSLALPHDTWVTLNLNPIPPDLRGGYTDYIDITHTQNSARGRLEMNYSTGAIRVKTLERDKNGNPVTISWTNNNSIWFPMRWFVPN